VPGLRDDIVAADEPASPSTGTTPDTNSISPARTASV